MLARISDMCFDFLMNIVVECGWPYRKEIPVAMLYLFENVMITVNVIATTSVQVLADRYGASFLLLNVSSS